MTVTAHYLFRVIEVEVGYSDGCDWKFPVWHLEHGKIEELKGEWFRKNLQVQQTSESSVGGWT
jgi:hypothetical protein